MGVKIFTSTLIKEQLAEAELQDLVSKFRSYKDTGDTAHFLAAIPIMIDRHL